MCVVAEVDGDKVGLAGGVSDEMDGGVRWAWNSGVGGDEVSDMFVGGCS